MALVNNLDEPDHGHDLALSNYADDPNQTDSSANDDLQAELDFKRMFNALEDGIFNINLDEEKKFNLENSKLNQFFASNSLPNSSIADSVVSNGLDVSSAFHLSSIAAQHPDMSKLEAAATVHTQSSGAQFMNNRESLLTQTVNSLGAMTTEPYHHFQHPGKPQPAQAYGEMSHDACVQQSYELARMANEFKEKFDDVHTAISYYTKAIQMNTIEFRFYYNRSICLQQANMLTEALDDANAAIQLVPNARKPYLRKAEILVQMNKFSEAEQALLECMNLANAIDLPVELVQEELRKMIRTTLIKFGFPEQIVETAIQCKSIEQAMDFAFNRQLEAKLNASNLFVKPPSLTTSQLTSEQVRKLGPISKSLDSQDTIDYYTDEEALNMTPNRKFSFNEEQLFNYGIGSPVKKNGFALAEANKQSILANQVVNYPQPHMLSNSFGANPFEGLASASGTSVNHLALDNNQSMVHPALVNKLNRCGMDIVRKRSSLSLSEPVDHFAKSLSFDPFLKNSFTDNVNKTDMNFAMMTSNLYSKSLGSSYSNLAHYMQNFHSNDNSQNEEVQVDPKYKELIERNNRCTNLIGYKGLWLGNISSNCSRERLISIFRKYGDPIVHQLKKSPCVFIKYNNEKSPTDAIQDLHGKIIVDIVHNKNDPLRLHFECNRRQQEENFPKNKMARNFKNGECYFWRTVSCSQGKNCPKIHVPINEKIDFQMWMLNDSNHKV
jgi:tetratricopeptide (TPR) repeat protein